MWVQKHNRQWWRGGRGRLFRPDCKFSFLFFAKPRVFPSFFPLCDSLLCSPLLAPGEVFFYLEEKGEHGKPRKPGWLIRRRRLKAQKRKMSRKVVPFLYISDLGLFFFQFSGNSASVRVRMSQSKKRRGREWIDFLLQLWYVWLLGRPGVNTWVIPLISPLFF